MEPVTIIFGAAFGVAAVSFGLEVREKNRWRRLALQADAAADKIFDKVQKANAQLQVARGETLAICQLFQTWDALPDKPVKGGPSLSAMLMEKRAAKKRLLDAVEQATSYRPQQQAATFDSVGQMSNGSFAQARAPAQ